MEEELFEESIGERLTLLLLRPLLGDVVISFNLWMDDDGDGVGWSGGFITNCSLVYLFTNVVCRVWFSTTFNAVF